MTFRDQTVLVTGAAGNLGRAVANAFAEQGANLVLVDQSQDRLEAAFGPDAVQRCLAPANLLVPEDAEAAVRKAIERFERLDAVCNLAGGFRMGEAVHETSDATWNFLLDLNVRTMLNTVRAAVPHLLRRGGGKVVNVGAYAAQRGGAQMGAYCATKSAVIRLTEAMAAELRDKGVNVNCVLPTVIDTPENRAAMPEADPGNWVAPEDLASVVLFLASKAARAIHGAAVPVTGLS